MMPTFEGDRCRSKKRAVECYDGRKLCDRCESQRQREQQSGNDGTSGGYGNVITDAEPIINEMLTYCLFRQKNSSSSAIKRVVMDLYTPEEICEAKQTLWDAYGENVLGVTPSRHDTQGRDAHDKEVDDILLTAATIDAGVQPAEQGWDAVSDLSLIYDLSQKFKQDLWRLKSKLKSETAHHSRWLCGGQLRSSPACGLRRAWPDLGSDAS